MTTSRKIILCLCATLFTLTLLRVPVTQTRNGYSSEQPRYAFDIGTHDEVRFDILLLWWGGIAGIGTVGWLMTGKKR